MGLAKELRNRRKVTPRKIDVQAWADPDGQPFAMYCYPITCYDINELQKKHPKFMENTTVAAMISEISGHMFAEIESVEEQEKN